MAHQQTDFSTLHLDMIEVERQARALQAQAIVDMVRYMRASIAARLRRISASQTA